jgi:hypothetical protein
MRLRLAPALAALALAAGCQSPDVGQSCDFDSGATGPVAADFMATGITVCENLVCLKSPGRSGGYCSKACVSDRDCSSGSTGLACRQVVLDPDFLAALPPDVRQKYLGDISFSSYCAVPLQ